MEEDRGASGPRRSGLVQERSRRTRRALVDAALALWTERGFDDGIDETTVEEIAHAAGVTKGTFYFHFAHKEDILLEIGWGTAAAMFKEATKYLADELPVQEALDKLLTTLARRIAAGPRAAVGRTIAEFYRGPARGVDPAADGTHFGFQRSFAMLISHAQETGQLPPEPDARLLAEMLFSLTMGAITAWVVDESSDLAVELRSRAVLLLAGVRGVESVGRRGA
jgi:AcrR family transcriptional regulator